MATENQHIIGKHFLDLEVISNENHFDLQQRLSQFFWEKVQPVLESVFDKYAGGEQIIQLEKLVVDLGQIPLENLEAEFVKKLKEQLEESLSKQILGGGGKAVKQTKKQSQFEQWIHFLEKGTLHWTATKIDETTQKAVLDTLGTSWIATRRLRNLLTKNQRAFKRLIYQFEDDFLATTAELFTGKKQTKLLIFLKEFQKEVQILKAKEQILQFELKSSNEIREVFWNSVLSMSIIKKEKKEAAFFKTHFVSAFFEEKTEKLVQEIFRTTITNKEETPKIRTAVSNYFIQKKGKEFLKKLEKEILQETAIFDKKLKQEKTENQIENEKREVGINDENRNPESEKELPKQNEENSNLDQKNMDFEKRKEANKADEKLRKEEKTELLKSQKAEHQTTADFPENRKELAKKNTSNLDIKPDQNAFEEIENGSSWYIQNAGIVLLHVFFKNLFSKMQLIEKQEFINEEARHRAIHLVQFLATGAESLPEYELLLPKFLCGLPFDIPIERNVELTKEEKEECQTLLKATIKHWGALGNSSPDALREGFLSREGKLEKRNNGWYLIIEKKTLDILLGKLPWGLSLIKLPWMPDLLRVEWG